MCGTILRLQNPAEIPTTFKQNQNDINDQWDKEIRNYAGKQCEE